MSSANIDTSADMHQLYCQHHGWLQGLLRKRLGNLCDAADLAQDVFVRLLLKPRQFDSHAGARAYLSVMAQGMCVDLWRKRNRARLARLARRTAGAGCPVSGRQQYHSRNPVSGRCHVACAAREGACRFYHGAGTGTPLSGHCRCAGRFRTHGEKYMAQAMLHCVLLEAEIDADGQATRS